MILLCSEDLLDASKTIASARAVGIAIAQCRTLDGLKTQLAEHGVSCCIIDLQAAGLALPAIVQAAASIVPRPLLVAYGPHVDAAGLKAARDAGIDRVMPRSKYFEEMPHQIAAWDSERGSPYPSGPART